MTRASLCDASHTHPALIVLDTNAVLDWLVFRDRSTDALSRALDCGRLRWIATGPMRREMVHVLQRGLDARAPQNTDDLWATWQRLCHPVDSPAPLPAAQRLACTDPDDQMFIDLALAAGARWLVTRDRALLRLARRAASRGVAITTPAGLAAP